MSFQTNQVVMIKLMQLIQPVNDNVPTTRALQLEVIASRKAEKVEHVLSDLHWLPVVETIDYKLLCYTYNCYNGTAPAYLNNLVKHYIIATEILCQIIKKS